MERVELIIEIMQDLRLLDEERVANLEGSVQKLERDYAQNPDLVKWEDLKDIGNEEVRQYQRIIRGYRGLGEKILGEDLKKFSEVAGRLSDVRERALTLLVTAKYREENLPQGGYQQ